MSLPSWLKRALASRALRGALAEALRILADQVGRRLPA